MSNTISQTGTGLIGYEDFTGQTPAGTATSTFWNLVAPAGQAWIVGTTGTMLAMKPSNTAFTYDNSWFAKPINQGTVIIQFRQRSIAATGWYKGWNSGTNSTWYYAGLGAQFYGGGGFAGNPLTSSQTLLNWTWATGTGAWYDVQFKTKKGDNWWCVYNGSNGDLQTIIKSGSNNQTLPLGTGTKGVGFNIANVETYITNMAMFSDSTFAVNGLVAGMTVNLMNGTGTTIDNSLNVGTAGTQILFDFGPVIFPLNKKIQIMGNDGVELFLGTAGSYWGGDVYTYSGSYNTPSVSPPTGISTIKFDNGTSGTHGILSFTPTNALSYDIYYATKPFDAFTKYKNTTNGTVAMGTLVNNTEYWIYVVGTNAGGASIPSPIVNGLIYGTGPGYFLNTMEILESNLITNCSWLKKIYIGDKDIKPYQMPVLSILPENEAQEDVAIAMGGKKDEIYNIKLRLFYAKATQDGEQGISDVAVYIGRIKAQLEAIKQYTPYWYNSFTGETDYGEVQKQDEIMKYADIKWQAKRRVVRTN